MLPLFVSLITLRYKRFTGTREGLGKHKLHESLKKPDMLLFVIIFFFFSLFLRLMSSFFSTLYSSFFYCSILLLSSASLILCRQYLSMKRIHGTFESGLHVSKQHCFCYSSLVSRSELGSGRRGSKQYWERSEYV